MSERYLSVSYAYRLPAGGEQFDQQGHLSMSVKSLLTSFSSTVITPYFQLIYRNSAIEIGRCWESNPQVSPILHHILILVFQLQGIGLHIVSVRYVQIGHSYQ